jgi:hypothetical protein
METKRCEAITKKGTLCTFPAAKDQLYCGRWPNHKPRCKGKKLNGIDCQGFVKKFGDLYCSFQHDPSRNGDITNPIVFRTDGIRTELGKEILIHYGHKDIHTRLEIGDLSTYQIDHITECQMFGNAVDMIRKTGTGFKESKANLIDFCKVNIVNTVPNLGFTATELNRTKGEAISEYIEELRTNQETKELIHYLGKKGIISRATSRNIRTNLYQSIHYCIDLLEDEQPLHSDFMEQFQKDIVNLQLNYTS